jgi:hypothetical protein
MWAMCQHAVWLNDAHVQTTWHCPSVCCDNSYVMHVAFLYCVLQLQQQQRCQPLDPWTRSSSDKVSVTSVGTAVMLDCVNTHLPQLVNKAAGQLDSTVSTVYRALGLTSCLVAASATTLGELKAAKKQHQAISATLAALARSLQRSDANAAALRYAEQLRRVVESVLDRKQQLLKRMLEGRVLLQQLSRAAAAAGPETLDPDTKQQLASAMAAVSSAQDGDVTYLEVTGRGVTVVPECVSVDFGVLLVGCEPQQRFLRITNATSSPLQLQLLQEQGSSSSGGLNGAGGEGGQSQPVGLSQAITAPKREVVVAPGQQAELQLVAGSCKEAGTGTATYHLSCISNSSCQLVEVTVTARYEQLSISLDPQQVEFGVVPSYKASVEQHLMVTNNTGTPCCLCYLSASVTVQRCARFCFAPIHHTSVRMCLLWSAILLLRACCLPHAWRLLAAAEVPDMQHVGCIASQAGLHHHTYCCLLYLPRCACALQGGARPVPWPPGRPVLPPGRLPAAAIPGGPAPAAAAAPGPHW